MKGHGLFGECENFRTYIEWKTVEVDEEGKKSIELGLEPNCRRAEPKKLNFVLWE